jgi:hypothetical protein
MLTGKVPFESTDPMELVHGHIARHPIPVHEVSPSVPVIVSICYRLKNRLVYNAIHHNTILFHIFLHEPIRQVYILLCQIGHVSQMGLKSELV